MGLFFGILLGVGGSIWARRYFRWRYAGGGWGGRGGGRSFWAVRWLHRALHPTPSQSELIDELARELMQKGDALKESFWRSRGAVANAFRGEQFDVGNLPNEQQAAVEAFREAVWSSLGKLHASLDGAQRRRLADMLEGHGGCHHHGRLHHHGRYAY